MLTLAAFDLGEAKEARSTVAALVVRLRTNVGKTVASTSELDWLKNRVDQWEGQSTIDTTATADAVSHIYTCGHKHNRCTVYTVAYSHQKVGRSATRYAGLLPLTWLHPTEAFLLQQLQAMQPSGSPRWRPQKGTLHLLHCSPSTLTRQKHRPLMESHVRVPLLWHSQAEEQHYTRQSHCCPNRVRPC